MTSGYHALVRRFLAVGLLALLASLGVWIAVRDGPSEHMAAYVAELRSRGEPASFADLEPPMPYADDNGARDLDLALVWLKQRLTRATDEVDEGSWTEHYAGPWNDALADPWYDNASAEQLDDVRALLGTFEPFFDRIEAATRKPEMAWRLPPSPVGLSAYGPERSSTAWRQAREVVEVQARVAATPDDRHRAVVSLLAVDRRVRLRGCMDHVIDAVRRKLSCVTLRDGVESGRLNATAIRPKCEALLRGGRVAMMPQLLRAHRVGTIEILPVFLDGSANASIRSRRKLLFGKRRSSTWEKWRDSFADRLSGVRSPWREYLAMLRDLDTVIPSDGIWTRKAEQDLTAFASTWSARGEDFLPRLCRLLRAGDALEELARVALAACEHRDVHGVWPESAAALAPLFPGGVPLDPYTNEPFSMTLDGETLVIRAQPPEGAIPKKGETLRDAGLEWRLPPR